MTDLTDVREMDDDVLELWLADRLEHLERDKNVIKKIELEIKMRLQPKLTLVGGTYAANR